MLSAYFGARADRAKHKNDRRDEGVHANEFPGVSEISRKDRDHCARKAKIAESDVFKSADSGPDAGKLAAQAR